MANIKARRKLSDLYRRGVEVRFGPGPDGKPMSRVPESGEGLLLDEDGKPVPFDESGDWVRMWIQPASPLQREQAMRDAQASRARALIRAKRNEDSEEHLTIMAFLADMDDETLIDYVLLGGSDTRQSDAIREVLGEDEWKDMEAYRDAIRQFDESGKTPEELEQDEEWVALMELDTKFGDQVQQRVAQLTDAERDVLRMLPRPNVEKKALERRAEMVGTQAFMAEYERQMTFYSVRDFDNQASCFFESARELADEPEEVVAVLKAAMVPFISDAAEAKNLQGAVSGSESSEPPSEPETSEASTPVVANA